MQAEQINVEYFFRRIYDLFYGAHSANGFADFWATLGHVWLWVIGIGYALSVLGFLLIIYITTKLFELREKEEEHLSTLLVAPGDTDTRNARWEHIQALLAGGSPSEWREAIVEADILLDDVLTEHGVPGDTLGDKLRNGSFDTLKNAGEAHGVRNQIAHQGSTFDLSESLARRTIQNYEAVFREFNAI
jgi:hypothetical protein